MISTSVKLDAPPQKLQAFSIATYARLKPEISSTTTQTSTGSNDEKLEYSIINQEGSDGSKREIFEVNIPSDADPGLVYNSSLDGDSQGRKMKYEFDKVFDVSATQEDVFNTVAKDRVIGALRDGMNCSILAYGQTGSGKTYSICGGESFIDRGLIPRTLSLLFNEIKQSKKLTQKSQSSSNISSNAPSSADIQRKIKCQVTFVEIYKDTVYDLLPPAEIEQSISSSKGSSKGPALPIVQVLESSSEEYGGSGQLILKNINVYETTTEEDALSLYFLGMNNRNTTATSMNIASSRSHAIFTIIVESEVTIDGKTSTTRGKINLVDLAGSERMYKKTNSRSQIAEAKAINLSLHYLEQVVVALRSNSKGNSSSSSSSNLSSANISMTGNGREKDAYIPYRNSVLTTLLRDSLGGNCRSCFLFTLSSAMEYLEESISTCRFAQRCGEVKTVIARSIDSSNQETVRELHLKLKALEKQNHLLEEQKAKLYHELENERHKRKKLCDPRTLSGDDKFHCKTCVQNLLTAAKETLQYGTTASNGSNIQGTPKELTAEEKQHILESSQDRLYSAVERMDKAVLVELSVALGGLVQTLYIEREKARHQISVNLEQIQTYEQQLSRHNSVETVNKDYDGSRGKQHTASSPQTIDGAVSVDEMPDGLIRTQSKISSISTSHILGIDLPDSTIRMLVIGASFIKHCRFGKKVRYVWLTPDLMNICWRQIGNMQTQKTISLKDFARVEVDSTTNKVKGKESCLLTLMKSDRGSRNLLIECAIYETLDENQRGAEVWAEALNKCIVRANAFQK